MEIKNYLPDISIDAKKLKQSLIKESHIKKVISDLNLSDEVIDLNLNTLNQYHRLKIKDETLPPNMDLKGFDVILVLQNDYLSLEYQIKPEEAKKQQALSFTKNYWINHLTTKQLMVSIEDINWDVYTGYSDVISLLSSTPKSFSKGLYLHGDIGIGKTFIMTAYANQQAKLGYSVCFVIMSRLLNEIKQTFNQSFQSEFENIMFKLVNCDLLVVDDIGAEAATAWSRDEILFTVLNQRMEAEKLTCFTSNLSKESLQDFYLNAGQVVDEIKSDRLMERFVVLSNFFELVSKKGSFRRAA